MGTYNNGLGSCSKKCNKICHKINVYSNKCSIAVFYKTKCSFGVGVT